MRALFTCLPGFGHFNPLVPLARALARSGHDVAFATAADFCPRVERAGFNAFPAGLSMTAQIAQAADLYPEAGLPPGKDRFERFVPKMLAGVAAPARADDLVPLVERWAPDVLVHDEAEFAAPVAAEVSGLPWASSSVVLRRPLAMARLAAEALEPVCNRWGVDLGPHAGLYRYLHLDACPPSLQDPLIDDIATAALLRNTEDLDTADGDILPPWIADLAPVPTVYATLGTVFNREPRVFAALLDGLSRSPVNVIATIGHDNDPATLGPQPPNVHLERYIPLSLLLPHLDAVATQGGTSILPALGAGLPLLVLPQGADQFHNAEACVRAGVGRQLLAEELNADAVYAEIRLLLESPVLRGNAQRVQGEFEAMATPAGGVGLLERLVAGRSRSKSPG